MYHHASDTLNGADSSGLHTGLGHLGQGQTSQELRYDRSKGGAKQTHGLAGVGSTVRNKGEVVNAHDPAFAGQRALDKDMPAGKRGSLGGPAAEDSPGECGEGGCEALKGR